MHLHVCVVPLEAGRESPGTRATDSLEPPSGAGNPAWVLHKTSQYSYKLSHLSSNMKQPFNHNVSFNYKMQPNSTQFDIIKYSMQNLFALISALPFQVAMSSEKQ